MNENCGHKKMSYLSQWGAAAGSSSLHGASRQKNQIQKKKNQKKKNLKKMNLEKMNLKENEKNEEEKKRWR
jgi:hypothetical protein